jgi:hypothetical protein
MVTHQLDEIAPPTRMLMIAAGYKDDNYADALRTIRCSSWRWGACRNSQTHFSAFCRVFCGRRPSAGCRPRDR